MTGIPEQGLGREHPGSWPWRPGCWPQCKPDLLTGPAHAARVWSWQRPSVAGGTQPALPTWTLQVWTEPRQPPPSCLACSSASLRHIPWLLQVPSWLPDGN